MKYVLSICILGLSWGLATAQTEKDFEDYGQLVYTKLITDEDYNTVDFMWVSDYRDYARAQHNGEKAERDVFTINANYEEWYRDYQNSVNQLKDYYQKARKEGGKTECLETLFTPTEGYDDLYQVDMSFIYSTDNLQNEVRITFRVIWYKNFFWLVTPFKENF